jgi:hypothetical protein
MISSSWLHTMGEHSGSEAVGKLRGLLLMQKEKDNVAECEREGQRQEVQYFQDGEQKGVEKD